MVMVALVSNMPVAILADAGFDDAWFWKRAESIASGHWMGGYDHMTLMKGSGYPLFLAFNHALGLSVMTSQALLYAGACLLLGTAIHRMTGRPWLSLLIVLAMQWHPASMAWTRVLRDGIGASQVILVIACLLHFMSAARAGTRGWRWAVLAGISLAWFWSTREDAVWIVPGIAVLVFAAALQAWQDRAGRRRLVAGSALAALAFAGWLSLVAGANLVKYGIFVTVETRESAYDEAMAALQRVRVGEPVPYVPVPREVRKAVYAVSPAFARLAPYFESAGIGWTEPGCGLYPHTCGDYAGGWFMWAFRDGVASIGAYDSAVAADTFYRQVADEVANACDDGRLECAGAVVATIPPMAASQWEDWPARTHKALSRLSWQRIGDGQTESHVHSPNARAMWEFVGKPMVPDLPGTLDGRAGGSPSVGIPRQAASPMTMRWIKYGIGLVYGGFLPWLTVAGLLAFCWASVDAARRRRVEPLYVLAAAAWCLVASRCVLLVLVDMSSFPALEVNYMQPVYALLVLAAFVSLVLLATGSGLVGGPAAHGRGEPRSMS